MQRGEIYYVAIPFATGCEIQKNRPAVIVSNDFLNEKSNMVTAVFLTTSDRRPDLRTHVDVLCKGRAATALIEQMQSVDKSRVGGFVGRVTDEEMADIDQAIRWALELEAEGGKTRETEPRWDGGLERMRVERDLFLGLVREAMA